MSRVNTVKFGCVSTVREILGFQCLFHWEFVVSIGMSRKRVNLKTSKPGEKIALNGKIGGQYLKGNKVFNEDKWVDKSK